MNNAITARANGNQVTFSRNTDSRITVVNAAMMTVFCRTNRDAADLANEAKAWGITSVVFAGPAARKQLGN